MVSFKSRRTIGGALAGLVLLGLAWTWLRPAPDHVGGATSGDRTQAKGGQLPRIDLARIDAKRPASGAGETDIFQFGAPSTKVVLRATPPPLPVMNPALAAGGAEASPLPASVPVMNVKYIGTVADKKGLKVAVLMTDRKEVLTGKAGDVVANRLKIVSIGLESVDIQDMGSDRVRRIPLRAN